MDPNQTLVQSLVKPNTLLTKNGSFYNHENLKDCKVFVLYFSAHWCPPCRQFTPILAQQFGIHQQNSKKSMVIFVSGDRSQQEQLNYMREAHGDWPATPCQSQLQMQLNSAFGVRGIPAVIVIKASNGEIISREGRQEIMQNGSSAFSTWEQSCVEIDTSVVSALTDNSNEVFKNAVDVLLKLMNNILKDPYSIKYRRIRLSNPKIESMLLVANGAFESLFSMGFEEDTDALFLPMSAPIEVVQAFKTAIERLTPPSDATSATEAKQSSEKPSNPEKDIICSGDICMDISKEKPLMGFERIEYVPTDSTMPIATNEFEQRFIGTIAGERSTSIARQNKSAHEKVFQIVPISKLETQAKEKFKLLFKEDSKLSLKYMRDLAVYELVQWFKKDFFTWVDKMKCDICAIDMSLIKMDAPNFQENQDGAGRVELYHCLQCSSAKRFPRYGRVPEKLLETRQGRCGEWANCFALMLTAFGFHTRHVNDFADHVWCEFYSEAENRWKHVDPCEGIVDKPKIYDHGWKKKLNYVIATSIHEVQDVTKRYVIDHEQLKKRRSWGKDDDWLNKLVMDQTDAWQKNLSNDLKTKLAQMRFAELAELMFSKSKNDFSEEESQGRQSGSLAWRLSRAETELESSKTIVIKPKPLEEESMIIDILFDITKDIYVRKSNGDEQISGWSNLAFEVDNMLKKEELDWNMVYLARKDGSKVGKIAWKIDLSNSKFNVKSVELLVQSKTFENGKIIWQLLGDAKALLPTPGIMLKSEELSGSKTLTLKATLSGGKGDVGWQHAQLFRTAFDKNDDSMQLKIIIKLKHDA